MNRLDFALVILSMCMAACAAPRQAPVAHGSSPAADAQEMRITSATADLDAIERAMELEDAPRKGKSKSLRVSDQLRPALAKARALTPRAPYDVAHVSAFEAACAEAQAAYLDSLLESTDPAQQPGEWVADDGRDRLGSDTVDAKLAAWQSRDPARPFAKFAVVKTPAGILEVRVGPLDVGHVDIAGGPSLSAGLLQTAVIDGRTRVVVLENTSGGFRPGPLRNRTTLRALRDLGYLPESASQLTVHDNPSGGYDHSQLIKPKS